MDLMTDIYSPSEVTRVKKTCLLDQILCKKLASRNLRNVIVRTLHVWFSRQCFYVKWRSVLSQSFHATHGVRQGGILSPHLFNVYINELSI